MKLLLTNLFLLIACTLLAQAPNANFTANPLSVCLGQSISFTNTSTPGGFPITQWNWDFGDGNSATTANATHTYAAPGTYTVTLVVTATNGQADAEVKVNYVTVNSLPVASFTTSGNGCTVPFNVTFNNTSSSGAGITYNWNFGNGQTSTLQNPAAVTYNSAGSYTVNLTVTNTNTGCTNTTSQNIVVSNYSTNFTAPATACVGQSVSFTDQSTVGTNSWSWNFGDGQTSTTQNPSITFSTPGTYNVTLNSQNTVAGCSGSIVKPITINPLPTPTFTSNVQTGCAPLTVNFTNTNTSGTSYSWNFGNGQTSTLTNPAPVVYNTNGTFTVSLTMTNANGCTATTTATNYITTTAPVANFSANVTSGCAPLGVQFTDASVSANPISDPIVSWVWNFGDATPNFSGQVPPVHNYNVGIFDVTLTITTQSGCVGTITMPGYIQVGSINNVNFSNAPTIECAKTDIDFTDLTTFNGTPNPGEVTWAWDFGDGGTSTQQNPSYQYAADTGYFDVRLIVTWRGCRDTLIVTDAVYIKAPISRFTPAQTLYCNQPVPQVVPVTDNAIIGRLSDDVRMIWRWGDGTADTDFNNAYLDANGNGSTSHTYNTWGSYTIKQVVYNYTTGCADSTTATVHISRIAASFTPSNDSTCINSAISLTGSTSQNSHPGATYTYNMGDGGSTSGNPASYTYTTSGTYSIVLTATNTVGCSTTATFNNMIALALPVASINPSATVGCAPINVTYNNTSTVAGNGVPLSFFSWTFPNASTQTTNNVATAVNYNYTTAGSFTTSMYATDVFGCVSAPTTVSMTITKPSASYSMDAVVCDLETFTATNASTGVAPLSYQWYTDGTLSSVTQNFTTQFDETTSGSTNNFPHTIRLIVTDANGCKDTSNQIVTVSMPQANFNYVLNGANVNANGDFTCPPVFGSYTNTSTSFGSITNYAWNFGDGKTSTLQNPNNTYVFAGTYTISLLITDEFGCTNDTTLVNYLSIGGPSGNPTWSNGGDICGQIYNFVLNNPVSVDSIVWYFGDGNSNNANVLSTSNSYLNNGLYNPTVHLFDDLGCQVIYEMPQITVIPNGVTASFTANPMSTFLFGEVNFTDQSFSTTSPLVNWSWNFNGTVVNSVTNAGQVNYYDAPGNYPVTLTVTNADGCTDQFTLYIFVDDKFEVPNVFTVNGDGANDVFNLKGDIFKSFDIVILNRWGEVVHNRTNATGIYLWDGVNKSGKDCTEGVYFWKINGKLKNDKEVKIHGNVTLIR